MEYLYRMDICKYMREILDKWNPMREEKDHEMVYEMRRTGFYSLSILVAAISEQRHKDCSNPSLLHLCRQLESILCDQLTTTISDLRGIKVRREKGEE